MKYLLIGLSLLLISFCSKENGTTIEQNDYLIFGHFYGECLGEKCVEIFKLTITELYEDVSDSYLATEFEFVPMSDELFEKVKDLKSALPKRLLGEDSDSFGCPDCADQGGLFIEVSNKGETRSWRIDQNKSAVPAYLHDFMDQVNEAIGLL